MKRRRHRRSHKNRRCGTTTQLIPPFESLASLLGGSPGISVIRDELSGWIASMDQYKGGKGAERQAYLSLWSSTALKIDRKGGGSVYVVVLSPQ